MSTLRGENLLKENKTLIKDIEVDIKEEIYYDFDCKSQCCEVVNSLHMWMPS